MFTKKVVVIDVDWNFFCNFAAVIVSEEKEENDKRNLYYTVAHNE